MSDNRKLFCCKRYKKKEWDGEKWVYYYHTNTKEAIKDWMGYDEKKRYNSAKNYRKLEEDMFFYKSNYLNSMRRDMEFKNGGQLTDLQKSNYQHFMNGRMYNKEQAQLYSRMEKYFLEDYKKTPLYKIEKAKESIGKGVEYVKSIFKKRK